MQARSRPATKGWVGMTCPSVGDIVLIELDSGPHLLVTAVDGAGNDRPLNSPRTPGFRPVEDHAS
ncbi:hypothetical protein GCM10009067_41220 [Haloarcula sebkhae]|uniref:Uncharacterized protein n=1 Tax=Haloarcula sebkhae TaxID=932660 RepID=A0A830EXN7_9EURY|nr:hypothetical protein GCM10009067_41220 [Haloarcula sebkhae]